MNKGNFLSDENKKILKLFVLLLLLLVLFISYGVYSKNNNRKSNDSKVISYLENKYNQKFEIIQLVDSRQYEESVLNCDNSELLPPRKIKGKYEYDYEILSISDNIKFNIYYLNDKSADSFKDSYTECKTVAKTIEEISNYIINTIGSTTSEKDFTIDEKTFSLYYNYNINIYSNEKLDEILEQNYITKLESIQTYTNNIIHSVSQRYHNMYYNGIYIYYQDGKYIKVGKTGTLHVFNKDNSSDISIDEYLENLND